MRSARWFLALCVGVLGFAANSPAVERTAYVFGPEGHLESIVLPSFDPMVPLSIITDFDDYPVGSAMDENGRCLTMFSGSNELVSLDLENGNYDVLQTLALDIFPWDDLTFGPSGRLFVLYSGLQQFPVLYEVDLETGGLTLLAQFDHRLSTIEYHQGAFFAGNSHQFWRIDPVTFEATLIRDYATSYTVCGVWGLASIGDILWCGYSCGTGPPSIQHAAHVGIIDPVSGWFEVHARLGDIWSPQEDPHTLQIIERITPIPALRPAGVVILVMLLGMVGILAIRRL